MARVELAMLRSLALPLAAVTLFTCTGNTEPSVTLRGMVVAEGATGCERLQRAVDLRNTTIYFIDASRLSPIMGMTRVLDVRENETEKGCTSSAAFTLALPRLEFYQAFVGRAPKGRTPEALELSEMFQPPVVALRDLEARGLRYEVRLLVDATGRITEVVGIP